MEEMKGRTHKLSDQHPLGAAFVMTLVCFLIFIVIGSIFEFIWSYLLRLPQSSGYPNVLASLLVLLIYWLWFRPEFEGALRGGKPGIGFKLGLFFLISWMTVPLQFAITSAKFGMPTFITIGNSLAAGFMEETIFRSAFLSTAMRKCRNEKLILLAAIWSAVIFGVVHSINGLVGANIGHTILQVFEAGLPRCPTRPPTYFTAPLISGMAMLLCTSALSSILPTIPPT